MFHQVSDKKYKALRSRNEAIRQMEFAPIDERLRQTIRLLGMVEGIQTVWSCSGHTPAERFARWRKANQDADPTEYYRGKWEECYFIFAAGDNSTPFLKLLSDIMNRSKHNEWCLNAKTLNWCFNDDGTNKKKEKLKKFDPYPVWEFGFRFNAYNMDEFNQHIRRFQNKLVDFIIKQDGHINLGEF